MTALPDIQSLAHTLRAAEERSAFAHQYAVGTTVVAPAAALFRYLDERGGAGWLAPRSAVQAAGEAQPAAADQQAGEGPAPRTRARHLAAEEIVVEYDAPRAKTWESAGAAHFLLGFYRMGYRLELRGDRTLLTVSISYSLPEGGFARRVAGLFAGDHARRAARRVVADAVAWSDYYVQEMRAAS